MNSRYEIRRVTLDAQAVLPIDEEAFSSIRTAKNSLFLLFQIEEDYDILVGNFLDLEKGLVSLAAESMLRVPQDRIVSDAERRHMNRMLANMLTSARSFVDHTTHNVSRLSGESAKVKLKRLFNGRYDRSLAYKVLEGLRNHTQHCGSPIYGLAYRRRWDNSEDSNSKLRHSVEPYISTRELSADSKFKKTVLRELETLEQQQVADGRIRLMPLVREYVGDLSSVLIEVRRMYEVRKNEWLKTLEFWVSAYREIVIEEFERTSPSVAAVCFDESGKLREEIDLLVDVKERLEFLEKSNREVLNLQSVEIVS